MGLILTSEGLVLFTGHEGRIARLVAESKLGRLGHSVVVGTPHEHDSIAHRRIEDKRYISKNTL
jgi:hypothetical protein